VRAIDPQGDVDSSPESRTWTIDATTQPPPDTTPPETNQPCCQPDYDTTAKFFLQGSDNMTAAADLKFECRIDDTSNEGWLPCTSPKEYPNLTDGTHFFEVRAKDSAGNVDPTPASRRFTIDTIPPETTITSHPSDPSGATPTFEFSGSDHVLWYFCRYYPTSGSVPLWSMCSSPYTLPRITASGSYTFEVYAYDWADNMDFSPASYTWTVDTTAPSAPLITSPTNNSFSTDGNFTISGSSEVGSTIELFEGLASKGTTQVDSSGRWSIELTGVAEGSHTYTAKAKNAAGNTLAASSSLTVIVDSTAPAAPSIVSPVEGSYDNDGTFTISGTAEATSKVALTEGTDSKGTATADGAGNWSIELKDSAKATDRAGNDSAESTPHTVIVDVTPPTAPVIDSPADNSFDTDGIITLSGTADANSTVEVFDGTTTEDTTSVDPSGAWTLTLPAVGDGSHAFSAKAKDAAHNISGFSNTRTVMVDTIKPTVKSTTPPNRAKGVRRDTNLTATFSEKMGASTVNATTLKLYKVNPDGSQTQITDVVVSLTSDGLKAKLNPFGSKRTVLAKNTKYKAVVTTGVTDLAGHPLVQQKSWTFTTSA
jgi:hypothetical protein